jgi:hypothetical protein
LRKRWLSPRALLLHLAMVVVVSGCALAAWWQATRALGGNTLSWVYSVEWPIFGLIAIAGWWQLVHEDPEAYQARKSRPRYTAETPVAARASEGDELEDPDEVEVEPVTVKWATVLAVAVGFEVLLGVMALVSVPIDRSSGWLPAKGEAVYLAHGFWGLLLMLVAVALIVRTRGMSRTSHIAAWLGLVGISIAGVGGLLTEATSLVRFFGMILMLLGAVLAAFGYMVPALTIRSRRVPAAPLG